MKTISSFVEPLASVFEQCLLSKDPQAHVATLPESPEKSILNFLLQPHTERFQEELIHKYSFGGELLSTLDQWKIQLKIANAKFPIEIKYLIDEHLKKYGKNYNFSKPAELQSTDGEIQNKEPTFPSELGQPQSLADWAEEQLKKKESSIFNFSKKAIRSLSHDKLLKLNAESKEAIFKSKILQEYPDKFVVVFVKSYYEEQIKKQSSFEIPESFYSKLSKSQFLELKNSIQSLIHNNQYLKIWYHFQFQQELQNFTKRDLTISEKNELRKLLLRIVKEFGEIETPKIKPIIRNTLKQLIALDISREEVEKDSFGFFKEYLENNITSNEYETVSLKTIREKSHQDDKGIDNDLGKLSFYKCSDKELIQSFIQLLFKREDAEAYVKKLESLLDKKLVLSTFAYSKLEQGESLEKHQAHLTTDELKAFREKREITIVPQNKRKWQANEEVTLKLRVKNVSKIHVQIYKLDLEKHLLESNKKIDETQSFSYLQPNHEYTYSTQTDSPYIVQMYDVKIDGIPSERGAWVIELEGEGISSRAFIRKGALANINTNNSLGTELKFYDENGTQLEKYFLWIEGKKHSVESLFTIPFGETEKDIDIIVTKDGYSEKFVVNVPREKYSLNISYIYNTESFIVGSIAKVLLHPTLRLSFDQTLDVNFKLLEKVKILVSLTNNLGIRSTIDFDNVQFKATEDYVLEFPVQSFTSNIKIAVEGKIKKYNNKEDTLASNHIININLGEDNLNFNDVYLRNGSEGYYLSVLGKNGEPSSFTQVVVSYRIDGIDEDEEQGQTLQTTKDGIIFLGSLKGVEHLTAEVSLKIGKFSRNWSFSKLEELDIPNEPIFREGEEIIFPTNSNENLQLWRVYEKRTFLENFDSQINQEKDKIVIKGLQKGEYVLIFPESDTEINFYVIQSKKWATESQLYDYQAGIILEISPLQNNHFSLGEPNFKKQENNTTLVKIPIQATYDLTKDKYFRAHLLASNFVIPNFKGRFSTKECRVNAGRKLQPFEVKHSEFYNNKELSEESSYVLNRKNEKQYIGNNLEKPKLFLKRIELRDTTQQNEVLQNEKNYPSKKCSKECTAYNELARCSKPRCRGDDLLSSTAIMDPDSITTQNNFLSLPGTLIANQKGNLLEFVVPEGYSHFECIVFNKKSSVIKKFDLVTDLLKRKNIKHSGIKDLNQSTAKTMSREVYKLAEGESIKVGRDSIWSAVGLSNIVGFSKIKGTILEDWVSNWNTYSNEEKLSVYDEKICHELNSYLKYNDHEFFAQIVQPFLKNKVTKTFVDLALLNDPDSLKWGNIPLIDELNEFEKVLLVEQLVLAGRKDEAEAIVSAMENKNKSNRISFENFKEEFDTVITAKLTEEAQKPFSFKKSSESYEMEKKKKKKARSSEKDWSDEDDEIDPLDKRKRFVNDFKQMEKTKEFTETTYSGMKNPRDSKGLVKESPFWSSAAQHLLTGTGTFLSENFMYLKRKIEFTLAASFIPNKKLLEYELKNEDDHTIIEASSNFLVFVKEVKSLPYERKFGVLLNQRFFNPDDRFYYEEDGTRIEKETDQFVVRRPYCVQTLITNTSGTSLELQLLIDIPEGSIPLKSHENTNIQSVDLKPYSTLSFERFFYFPATGSYRLYPSNACRGGLVIAKSEQLNQFEVTEKEIIKALDTLSNVLKSGNKEAVLSYIEAKNIFDSKVFEPSYILWMLKDKDFFLRTVEIFRKRRYYSNKIWVLGYYHNDLVTISEYEQSETNKTENIFNNPPIFEYFPYYSSRAHKFLNQNKSTIRNDQFKNAYFNFLFVGLLNEPTSSKSRATFIYYLLLQDRIDEAYSALCLLSEKEKQEHAIQFDYIESFIDMYKGFPSFSIAREISSKYLNYPVKSWQRLFKEIIDTLKEYDSEEVIEEVRTLQFSTTVLNEGNQLKLSIPAKTSVEVYIYGLNLELYFSEFPFTDFNTLTTKTIPNSIKTFAISNESREEKILRADELKDCFVEVYSSSDGSRKKKVSSILWSNPNIKVNIKEKNGVAQVFYENKKQPGCYVKVYQKRHGKESFYRDGYTDITGTFKYALADLDGITEFVILFITENGGVVHKVKPPSTQGYFG